MCNRHPNSEKRPPHHRPILALLLILGFGSTTAAASVITLDLTADLFAGTITSITDVNNFSGEGWESASLSFAPITLNEGDQLNLNVLFAAGQSMTLASGNYDSGKEYVGFRNRPQPAISALQAVSTLSSLSAVSGNLDASLPITSSFTTSNQLTGIAVGNYTDTAVSFGGFSLNTVYNTLTGAPVTLSSLELFAAAEDITLSRTSIPEPGTSALLLLGLLGVIGAGRRQRGRLSV